MKEYLSVSLTILWFSLHFFALFIPDPASADQEKVRQIAAVAIEEDDLQGLLFLLSSDGWNDYSDQLGPELLGFASSLGNQGAIGALVATGVDINAQGSGGWSALSIALMANQIETAKLILSLGGDPTLESSGGVSPVDIANSLNLHELDLSLAREPNPQQTTPVRPTRTGELCPRNNSYVVGSRGDYCIFSVYDNPVTHAYTRTCQANVCFGYNMYLFLTYDPGSGLQVKNSYNRSNPHGLMLMGQKSASIYSTREVSFEFDGGCSTSATPKLSHDYRIHYGGGVMVTEHSAPHMDANTLGWEDLDLKEGPEEADWYECAKKSDIVTVRYFDGSGNPMEERFPLDGFIEAAHSVHKIVQKQYYALLREAREHSLYCKKEASWRFCYEDYVETIFSPYSQF